MNSGLIAQFDDIIASYPPHIQHDNFEYRSQSGAGGSYGRNLYIITRIHLDVLQCRFLIQRLNVSRCYATGQELLDIAQEKMTTVLSVWLNRDQLRDYNHAFNWIVRLLIPSSSHKSQPR